MGMTPKEKAKELVLKFGEYTVQESWQSKNYFAIECALIAVDETLNSVKDNFIYSIKFREYWQEVKKEIENF